MSDAVHLCHLLPLPSPTVCVCRDFSTEVDIALRKWAEDKGRLARLCTAAAQESVLEVLRSKIEVSRGEGADTVLRGEPLQEIVCRYMLVEYDLLLPLPSPPLPSRQPRMAHSTVLARACAGMWRSSVGSCTIGALTTLTSW